ncbi:MAG TPA: hypothetical protein ENH10_10690 [Bacteroidetes bacterium]|nr:hypothetical protein [Bacteroidota bacterium]HEX05600.1 hypothetical protein [Bacteroidota bacterium]
MSRIEPDNIFRLFQKPAYNRQLRQARSYSLSFQPSADSPSHLVLVTSSDPAVAMQELRFVRNKPIMAKYLSVSCITPTVAWNALDNLPANMTCLPYGPEQISRLGLPTASFRQRVRRMASTTCVLLPVTRDPFPEVLFSHLQSLQKVAFYQPTRDIQTTLIVSPADMSTQQDSMVHLFRSIETFLPR